MVACPVVSACVTPQTAHTLILGDRVTASAAQFKAEGGNTMATQSYPRPVSATDPPALETRWRAEDGRLRSRWAVASQLRQLKPIWLAQLCNRTSIVKQATGLRVHSSRLLHVLCWLLVLFF